jgi:hypothetical protein
MNPLLQRPEGSVGPRRHVAKLPSIDPRPVAAALTSVKDQIVGNRENGNLEIAEILNRALAPWRVTFSDEMGQESAHPQHARFSITHAVTDVQGNVVIGFSNDFYQQFEDMTPQEWANFTNVVASLVVHELTHRGQINAIRRDNPNEYDAQNAMRSMEADPSSQWKYYSNPHEIAAFARTIVQELRAVNYDDQAILTLLRDANKMKDSAADSDQLWIYMDLFGQDDPVFKQLLREIFKVVQSKSATHKTPPLADNTYPEGSNGWAIINERQQGSNSPVPLEFMMPEEFGIEPKTGSTVTVRQMTGTEVYQEIQKDRRLLEETMYLRHSNLRTDARAIHFVAFEGDKVVGDLELQENPYDDNVYWFAHVTTRVGYKKQGISNQMIRACLDFCNKSNRRILKISTFSDEGEQRVKPTLERLRAEYPNVQIVFSNSKTGAAAKGHHAALDSKYVKDDECPNYPDNQFVYRGTSMSEIAQVFRGGDTGDYWGCDFNYSSDFADGYAGGGAGAVMVADPAGRYPKPDEIVALLEPHTGRIIWERAGGWKDPQFQQRYEAVKSASVTKVAFKIEVPKASREHFWEEPPEGNHEFWAFRHPVICLPGEKIVFTFDSVPVAEALVLRTEGPGTTECQQTGKYKNHHKVFWDPKQFRSL